jgi:hypothetical protein
MPATLCGLPPAGQGYSLYADSPSAQCGCGPWACRPGARGSGTPFRSGCSGTPAAGPPPWDGGPPRFRSGCSGTPAAGAPSWDGGPPRFRSGDLAASAAALRPLLQPRAWARSGRCGYGTRGAAGSAPPWQGARAAGRPAGAPALLVCGLGDAGPAFRFGAALASSLGRVAWGRCSVPCGESPRCGPTGRRWPGGAASRLSGRCLGAFGLWARGCWSGLPLWGYPGAVTWARRLGPLPGAPRRVAALPTDRPVPRRRDPRYGRCLRRSDPRRIRRSPARRPTTQAAPAGARGPSG